MAALDEFKILQNELNYQMNQIPNESNTKWTKYQMNQILNESNTEWTKLTNEPNHKWTNYWMNQFPEWTDWLNSFKPPGKKYFT